jgi:hypothetical protein
VVVDQEELKLHLSTLIEAELGNLLKVPRTIHQEYSSRHVNVGLAVL